MDYLTMHCCKSFVFHCKSCLEFVLLIINFFFIFLMLFFHLQFSDLFFSYFEFPLEGMLLFELFIFKCMSLSHSMFSILLCSLERFMILFMMCFNRVFFPFKSMLKLVFTLVKRHHMVVVRWNVELFNKSYFLFFMLLFRF